MSLLCLKHWQHDFRIIITIQYGVTGVLDFSNIQSIDSFCIVLTVVKTTELSSPPHTNVPAVSDDSGIGSIETVLTGVVITELSSPS